MSEAVPRLFSLPPAWGLPSFHPECMKVYAYLRMAGVRFESNQSTAAVMTSYETPVLVVDEEKPLTGWDDITTHLRKQGYDLDANAKLGQQDRAEVFAFISMIEGQLLNAMMYDWWIVDDNYYNVIRPLYAKSASFPASFLLPWSLRRRMRARLGNPTAEEGEHIYKQAENCYAALEARLGQHSFFYGEVPSSLDAVVFAHLATHLYAPMPHPARLASHIQKLPNLCSFVERVQSKYMGVSLGIFSRNTANLSSGKPGSEGLFTCDASLHCLCVACPPHANKETLVENVEDEVNPCDGSASKAPPQKKERSPKEKARRRRARDFIVFGVLLTVGFVLLSNWITVEAADGGGE